MFAEEEEEEAEDLRLWRPGSRAYGRVKSETETSAPPTLDRPGGAAPGAGGSQPESASQPTFSCLPLALLQES